jgi:cytidylate kinase
MIITIGGNAGSGKSTVARMLAEKLGFEKYSMGDVRRKMALERGMTIEEFNKLGETEGFTDMDADKYQEKLASEQDNFVIDGRLSFHFIPNSLKIFLYCDPEIAARRIYDSRNDEARINQQKTESFEEQLQLTLDRDKSDRFRYEKYYGIKDLSDKKNYDLYIDDTNISQEEVLELILKHLEHLKHKSEHRIVF